MIFSKIFKFFLFFAVFSVWISPAYGVIYTLNNHCEFDFSPTSELFASALMNYAHELDNQLLKIFPKAKQEKDKNKKRKFTIKITDSPQKTISVQQQKRHISITVNGITPNFRSDYKFLYNLFSAVVIQQMPYEDEDVRTNWTLPHWFFLALHSKIKSAVAPTLLLRNSRTIAGMRLFLEKDFFPDLHLLESSKFENMSDIELFFIQDYCRFIYDLCSMYSAKKPNVNGIYIRELYLENSLSDAAVFQRVIVNFLQKHAENHLIRMLDIPEKYTEKERLHIFFKFHADHLAYSYAAPADSAYLKKRFQEFRNVRFAEIGPNQKPTGKIIESTIDKLPELIRRHSNVKDFIQLKKGELLHLRSISSSYLSQEANHLLELLSNIQDSWLFGTSQRQLRNAFHQIVLKINTLANIEDILAENELKHLSIFQIFPYEFAAEKNHRNAGAPDSAIKALENIEKNYLK